MSVYLKCKAGGSKFSFEGKTSADKPYLAMNYTTQTGSESSQTTMSKAYIPLTTDTRAIADDKNIVINVSTQTGNTPSQSTITKLYALGRPVKTITYTSWSGTQILTSYDSQTDQLIVKNTYLSKGSCYYSTRRDSSIIVRISDSRTMECYTMADTDNISVYISNNKETSILLTSNSYIITAIYNNTSNAPIWNILEIGNSDNYTRYSYDGLHFTRVSSSTSSTQSISSSAGVKYTSRTTYATTEYEDIVNGTKVDKYISSYYSSSSNESCTSSYTSTVTTFDDN